MRLFFATSQGASLCFCFTKTRRPAGTELAFAPDGRKRGHCKSAMESQHKEDKKRRGKGGRPLKKVKRESHIRVRLTSTEHFLIGEKSKKAGMKISEWFRKSAIRAKVLSRVSKEDLASLRMLSGMANNLNQLTRLAHRQGLLVVERRCRELITLIDGVLKNMNRDDR